MKNLSKPLVTLGLLLLLPTASMAQNREIAVQGSDETGGSQTHIGGRLYGSVDITLTGAASQDTAEVRIRDASGRYVLLFSKTIQQLINDVNAGVGPFIFRRPPTRNGGETRVYLRLLNAQPTFQDARVRLRRGNYLFDEDPVILR